VVVQTYDPDHYAIRAAAEHDYDAFYEQESEERRLLSYPPFGQLVRLVLEAEDEQLVAAAAGELDNILRGEAEQLSAPLKIMGPAPAPLSRLRSRFRWHLVVQGPRSRSAAGQMHQVLMRSREAFSAAAPSGIVLHIDVDPASLL
jgi:primosomal protein N' (replication factor Y)